MDTSREKFLMELNKIVEEFFVESGYPTRLKESTRQMIDYVIPSYNEAIVPLLTLNVTQIIKPNLNDEELQMVNSLGWIYQMCEAYVLVQDDYFDEGDRRYGKTSWSKLHNHSKTVIVHDASLLRALTFFTMQRMFSHSPSTYLKLVDLFLDFENLILKGSLLDANFDMKNLREGKIELESFSMEAYNIMASTKAVGFIMMPVNLAMIITGYDVERNSELEKNIRRIYNDLSVITTAFDDYYDIFTSSSVLKSSDSDIRRGQFSWLFVKALETCRDKDKGQELIEHYGKDSDESVAFIRALYENIGIHDLFEKYCEVEFKKTMGKVETFFVENKVVKEIMTWFVPFLVNSLKDGPLSRCFE